MSETGHIIVFSVSPDKLGGAKLISWNNEDELPTTLDGKPLSYFIPETEGGNKVFAIVWPKQGITPIIYQIKVERVCRWKLVNRD